MSWPGFSALANAWWFLLLIPLVIVYFLKLRRPTVDIPSLALWRQVINDQRVNSPFQRFKRNLLLLFQVLLLCALVLGAMRPYLSSGNQHVQHLPILIDTSASMAALDEQGGISRLDEARAKINKLIDDMLPDQQLCLISVNSTARRLTEFTDNKRLLREALSRAEVTHLPSRLEEGFRLAQALSRGYSITTATLFSDGNVPTDVEFELPFKLNYQRLKPGGQNVGIVDFNARRSKTGWDVFARVEASRGALATIDYELLQNGQSIKKDSFSIHGAKEEPAVPAANPGGEKPSKPDSSSTAERLVFKIATDVPVSLELRLKPQTFDSLEADNVAYLDLPQPRPLTVYCPLQMETYRHALSAVPGIELFPGEGSEPKVVDLKFADGPLSTGPDCRVSFNTGFVPNDLEKLVELEAGLAEVVDWRRTAPLLQHVQLLDVQIADAPKLAANVQDRDFELAGYEILAESRTGPLILEKPTDGHLDIHFLFHTDRSSLVYRVGFPILVQNAIQIALQRAELAEARGIPTGSLPGIQVPVETTFSVAGPRGTSDSIQSDSNGTLQGIAAPYAGVYEITGGDKEIRRGVSLLSSDESSLAFAEKLNFPEVTVTANEVAVTSDQPLWGYFALAGLLLLFVEWWYFQKRPSGVPGAV